MSPPMPLWVAGLCSLLGGFALTLANAPFGIWPLSFAAIAAATVTLIGRRWGQATLLSGVFGGAFYLTHIEWVGRFLGPLPWLALAGLESLIFAVGGAIMALVLTWASRRPARGGVQLLLVPALIAGVWATREVIMGSWPYSGFPWGRIGVSQVGGPLASVASWIGVTGLTFLVVVFVVAVLQWLRAGGPNFGRGAVPAVLVGVALAATPPFSTAEAGAVTVGWVQGNGPTGYFDPRAPGDILAAQVAATGPLLGRPMDLLVWPEGSVDGDPFADPAIAAALDAIVAAAGAPLLMNAATQRGEDVFNSSLLWTAEVTEQLSYDKINPVPFGEYVPDRWLFEQLAPDLISRIQREYTPGTAPPVMALEEFVVGLAICFDVIYDDVIWDAVQGGAQVFVFQTNNADFRGTSENLQQLAVARMRAIETGRAVVNVSTVGTSEVIAPDGTTMDAVGIDEVGAAVTTVPLRSGMTPAVIVGPWVAPLLAVGSAVGFAFLLVRHRTRAQESSEWAREDTAIGGE